MGWIKSDYRIGRHPGTLRLARELSISLNESIGMVHRLLWFATDFTTDGDLTNYGAQDIADAVGFEGSEFDLLIALVNSEIITAEPDDEDGSMFPSHMAFDIENARD